MRAVEMHMFDGCVELQEIILMCSQKKRKIKEFLSRWFGQTPNIKMAPYEVCITKSSSQGKGEEINKDL